MLYIVLGIVGIVLVLLIVLLGFSYKKASPDRAYVVSGIFPKIFTGKGSFVIPVLQKCDVMHISTFPIDIKTKNAVPTAEYINVNVDAAAICKISSNPEMLKKASENFLNKETDYISRQIQEVLEGNIREIIGQMKLADMVADRKQFAEKVQENVVPDLARMGIELISLTVQDFSDNNGIIKDLGIDHTVAIQTKAKKSRAEAEAQQAEAQAESEKRKAKALSEASMEAARIDTNTKLEIKRAEALAEKEANNVQVATQTEIAIKNNELHIKEAKLKEEADIAKAKADVAYEIQKQEERKTLEIRQADADIAKQEKAVIVRQKEAEVREQFLIAEVNKEADAERYRRIQQAEAEKRERELEAEAQLIEAQLKAKAMKLEAEARKYEKQQEAEAIRELGLAEADAIKAKGVAEAEAIDRKAEAMEKYGEAAMIEMITAVLPQVAKSVAQPLENVDKITMYGEGNQARLIKDVMTNMDQISEGLGLDIKSIMSGVLSGSNITKK